jgi:hypothetical protein
MFSNGNSFGIGRELRETMPFRLMRGNQDRGCI